MIIDSVYHPKLAPTVQPDHTDYKNQIIRSPNTYRLVAKHSEYCTNYDVILYHIGFEASALKTPLTSILSHGQIQNIREGKILLAIDFSLEVSNDQLSELYDNIIIKEQIPPTSVLAIVHSMDYKEKLKQLAVKYNQPTIKCEHFGYWNRLQQLVCKETFNNLGYKDYNQFLSGLYSNSTKKKFLFLNHNWKEHRIALMCLLNDLLDNSYTSFAERPKREGLHARLLRQNQPIPDYLIKEQYAPIEDNWGAWLEYTKQRFPSLSDHLTMDVAYKFPFTLDKKDFPYTIAYTDQANLLKYYKNTYFSVVTETHYGDRDSFITEKIFKAISFKHPFVYCGNSRSLEQLRELGYKTFQGVINEDYDTESDDSKRLLMIRDEIKRLCSLSDNELSIFKEQCKPIVEHNFNLFMNEKSFITRLL